KQGVVPDDASTRTTWVAETTNLTKFAPPEWLVMRKTSLDSRELVGLAPGSSIRAPAPDGATLIGFSLNAATSNAVLALTGERRILKDTRNALYRAPDKYLFGVWSVQNGLVPKDGGIAVGSRAELAAEPGEEVESIEAPHPTCDTAHLTVEIES